MLIARGHYPLSVRRIRWKKYSMSTRIECVQTKFMNFYSPIPPLLSPSLTTSVWLLRFAPLNPILLRIKRLLLVPTIKMPLVSALLTGNIRYLLAPHPFSKEDTKVERVRHGQEHLGRQRSPRLRPLLWQRRPKVTNILDFEGNCGMMTMNPCVWMCFVMNLVDFLMYEASQSEAKWRRTQPFLSRWDGVFSLSK